MIRGRSQYNVYNLKLWLLPIQIRVNLLDSLQTYTRHAASSRRAGEQQGMGNAVPKLLLLFQSLPALVGMKSKSELISWR